MTALMWFRNDLRVADNPALSRACRHDQVIACFFECAEQWRQHDVGPRRLAFLGRCVNALSRELAALGIPLVVETIDRFDAAGETLLRLAKEHGADSVFANAEYPLNEKRRDAAAQKTLTDNGIRCSFSHGTVTAIPGSVLTQAGNTYAVFSPFKRRWMEIVPPHTVALCETPAAQGEAIAPATLASLAGVTVQLQADDYPGGERHAQARLQSFVTSNVEQYADTRDMPSQPGTSGLSPYLSVGAVSSNQCLAAALDQNEGRYTGGPADAWINEIIWREFYRHVVAAFPHVSRGEDFRPEYRRLPWRSAPAELTAWQSGNTGYPFVDAGMRQLNETGWMHNRLRMVTAMFLTKHLLIDWRAGERYFMHQLVDGDFASNNGGWQWSASTGTDAAPYFRVFNPTTQGKRFDPEGHFVRRWIPEIASVPDRFLFEPHRSESAPDYPPPIVEHGFARQRAIDTFKSIS